MSSSSASLSSSDDDGSSSGHAPQPARRRAGGRRRIDEQTPEERALYRATRKQRNRAAAIASRERRQIEHAELLSIMEHLKTENARLAAENADLRRLVGLASPAHLAVTAAPTAPPAAGAPALDEPVAAVPAAGAPALDEPVAAVLAAPRRPVAIASARPRPAHKVAASAATKPPLPQQLYQPARPPLHEELLGSGAVSFLNVLPWLLWLSAWSPRASWTAPVWSPPTPPCPAWPMGPTSLPMLTTSTKACSHPSAARSRVPPARTSLLRPPEAAIGGTNRT